MAEFTLEERIVDERGYASYRALPLREHDFPAAMRRSVRQWNAQFQPQVAKALSPEAGFTAGTNLLTISNSISKARDRIYAFLNSARHG